VTPLVIWVAEQNADLTLILKLGQILRFWTTPSITGRKKSCQPEIPQPTGLVKDNNKISYESVEPMNLVSRFNFFPSCSIVQSNSFACGIFA